MGESKRPRTHSPEFRIEIAQRMLAGENVVALSRRYKLARSMMYRWRETYHQAGPAGLARSPGKPRTQSSGRPTRAEGSEEQRLRQRIAELERKVGRQAVEIDFFKGVFRRLEELPKAPRRGGAASTPKSDE